MEEDDLIVYTVKKENLPVVMRTIFDEMTEDSHVVYSEQIVDNALDIFVEVFPTDENGDYEFTLETMTQLVHRVLIEDELDNTNLGVNSDGEIEVINE